VFTHARVDQVPLRDGRVACGWRRPRNRIAPRNIGLAREHLRAVAEPVAREHGYDRLLQTVKPSIGYLGVCVGLRRPNSAAKTNYWFT
jgi:hypothetical protein